MSKITVPLGCTAVFTFLFLQKLYLQIFPHTGQFFILPVISLSNNFKILNNKIMFFDGYLYLNDPIFILVYKNMALSLSASGLHLSIMGIY